MLFSIILLAVEWLYCSVCINKPELFPELSQLPKLDGMLDFQVNAFLSYTEN